jgi:hypothetical protein
MCGSSQSVTGDSTVACSICLVGLMISASRHADGGGGVEMHES